MPPGSAAGTQRVKRGGGNKTRGLEQAGRGRYSASPGEARGACPGLCLTLRALAGVARAAPVGQVVGAALGQGDDVVVLDAGEAAEVLDRERGEDDGAGVARLAFAAAGPGH